MACYGENTYNLFHGSLLHLQNLDGVFLVKNVLTFSTRNSLPTCTFAAAAFLSHSISSHVLLMSMEKRKGEHEGLSSFLVPAWLHKTLSPVRPYPSWEPQGTSERHYNPLSELLQPPMHALFSFKHGKWEWVVLLFWFPPACCFWGRRPLFREVQSASSKTPTASNRVEGLRSRQPFEHSGCCVRGCRMQCSLPILLRIARLLFKHRLLKYEVYR